MQLVSSQKQLQWQHTTRTLESSPTLTPFNYNVLKLHSFKKYLMEHFYSIFLLILHASLQGLQLLSAHQWVIRAQDNFKHHFN